MEFLQGKDVANITGKTYSAANRLIIKIRDYYNIEHRKEITVSEFCEYMNLPEQLVLTAVFPKYKK